jgi:hypothetical protein
MPSAARPIASVAVVDAPVKGSGDELEAPDEKPEFEN